MEWQAKNYIKKIRKGYYYFPERDINENFLMHISNKIYKPSYISMATALSYYNLIQEGVYLITGISTRKTMLFETPLGNFGYRAIKNELFFGYRLIQQGDYNIRYAEVEKSILDFFYFNKINMEEMADDVRPFLIIVTVGTPYKKTRQDSFWVVRLEQLELPNPAGQRP
ncbi:MAG: hypothetical protein HQ543_10065 [Bacteroidetes bacterium]|nr:hypothetical protein [Bacteroidota bacterium]